MQNTGYLKKVNSESVVQQIINSLTDAMINRQLRPGDKIPTEMELAETMGVGRNSVREAIKILIYLGVLEIRRAEGTFVCEGFSESMIDPMIYGIILDKEDSYEKLMELRELIEVGVMQLAMRKMDESHLQQLEEKLICMKEEIAQGAGNVEKVFLADSAFHDKISEMGDNPLVNKINQVVRVLTYGLRYETVKTMLETGRGQELYKAHEQIYTIMAQKDTHDMNQAVRLTYFSDILSDSKK